jgi:hypothetical protein
MAEFKPYSSVKHLGGTIRGLCLAPDGQSVIVNLANDCLKQFNVVDEMLVDFSTNIHIQFDSISKCNQVDFIYKFR